MKNEKILNEVYNKGGFNRPERIGHVMALIRALEPMTEDEWRIWYCNQIHSESYLDELSYEMTACLPVGCELTSVDCREYIDDVMFHRTFKGYNKEKQALKFLRQIISEDVKESPEEWDAQYFIDFYIESPQHQLIGIQLKPESFYLGRYEKKVDIQKKMSIFCNEYNAVTFVLVYKVNVSSGTIVLKNYDVVNQIKDILKQCL